MKSKFKAIYITLALVLLTLIAAFAGIGLAIWDTGSSVKEVYSLAFNDTGKVVVAEKKTIEIEENPITGLKDDIEPDTSSEAKGNVKQLSEQGGIKSIINNTGEKAENTDEETVENTENTIDEVKEKEPIRITAEISGIETIVRAGDSESETVNEIKIPEQPKVTNENIDPLKDYPLPYEEVDLSYFDDALFIGDSRVAGLAMNSGTNATFYAVTSFQLYRYKTFKVVQTPSGKVPIFDAMPYDKFTKIYIKVGLNELGSVTDEPFFDAYTSLINDLRVMQPRAIIYIQAILPVTQVKSQTDRVHCNENIKKRNENLKSFAELMKCYYVDVGPYFADETGALKAETTADGIHMYSKYMPMWIDALRKQAVKWPPAE
ncbi:MAG: GDSL-type esterase/lipase family protein [Lachnospiraceae bacterium]|nr:GDSL-type esterase/lipase family protein [Lachnospiraceae bacterium]MDY5640699.1 GDSL-type esterase/lipase family protein [Lachnospiraceae bacterium]